MARKKKADTEDAVEVTGVESHPWVIERLKDAQKADHDNRENARECVLFVHERGGQWEEKWWNNCDQKPRYTFDLVSPILDQVQGTMDASDYDIHVLPASGEASEEVAETYDGLVRNIERVSQATDVYSRAGKSMVVRGLSGWRIVQRYVDGDSFDQDLVIDMVPNWLDSVWLGPHTLQDGSDAQYAWILVGLTPDDFKKKYPDRAESGVSSDRATTNYFNRPDLIMVGEFMYFKDVERELVSMTDGSVYEVDEKFKAVEDELAAKQITVRARRKRTKKQVMIRKFDADGWIDDEPQPTVFENWLPLVPLYGNFEVVEDGKVIYYGAVEKLIDPQRVFNYSLSREIEEGALAPRAKWWMTPEQVAGHEKTIGTLNTNSDPVQLFNPDERLPGPPQQNGGAQVNPGLARISEAMQAIVGQSAGMFAANMGDNPNLQSGVAIDLLQERGDQGSNKYITAREIAQRHTGRILVNAIPRVYMPGRQVRILQPDGSFDMEVLGQPVLDQQTQQVVVLNDLSKGCYDVQCNSGPSFKTRQGRTVSAFTEVGAIDPSVVQIGGDVFLRNIEAPGMDLVADRKRAQLIQQGLIPFEQLTDDEKQQVMAQQQQPQQPDAMMVAAMAEQKKAEADMLAEQNKQAEIMLKAQQQQADVAMKEKELQIKAFSEETRRYEADIARGVALADIKGKAAQAAKVLAEAEAIDIANDKEHSGIQGVLDRIKEATAKDAEAVANV